MVRFHRRAGPEVLRLLRAFLFFPAGRNWQRISARMPKSAGRTRSHVLNHGPAGCRARVTRCVICDEAICHGCVEEHGCIVARTPSRASRIENQERESA